MKKKRSEQFFVVGMQNDKFLSSFSINKSLAGQYGFMKKTAFFYLYFLINSHLAPKFIV